MEIKQGRARRYGFDVSGTLGPELTYQLAWLDELAVRVADQVAHLPAEVLNYTAPNSQLSIGRLVLHLVGSDRSMLACALTDVPEPPYLAELQKGLLADFSLPPGDLSNAPSVLDQHLVWRREHLLDRWAVPGFLDQVPNHAICRTNRELAAHMDWHWVYHSGHIGLLAMEAGYDYVWTGTKR